MAEIFSTIAAALTVLEGSITLLSKIVDARKNSKSHFKDLARHLTALNDAKTDLEVDKKLIDNIEELRTPEVKKCADKIKVTCEDFNGLVISLEGEDGFLDKLFRWKSKSKVLSERSIELHNAEERLHRAILRVNIGLTKGVSDLQKQVNRQKVLEINAKVRQILKDGPNLVIADLIQNKDPDENGNVTLESADLAKLAFSEEKISIRDNKTRNYALMLNAPIVKQLPRDEGSRDIHNNFADSGSQMYNSPQTEDTFQKTISLMPKPVDYTTLAFIAGVVLITYIIFGK